METFLKIIREILKGIVREVGAYIFRKNVLVNKKTTLAVTSKWVILKTNKVLTTTTLTVEVAVKSVAILLSLSITIIHENIPNF